MSIKTGQFKKLCNHIRQVASFSVIGNRVWNTVEHLRRVFLQKS